MTRTALLVLAAFAILVTAPRSSVGAQTPDDNTPEPDVVIEAYSNNNAAFSKLWAVPEKRAGDSVYIRVTELGPYGSTGTLFRFSVNAASDASGTFTSSRGTSLNCRDQRRCDLDSDSDSIIVQFDIADDANANTNLLIDLINVNANKTVRIQVEVIETAGPAGPAKEITVDAEQISMPVGDSVFIVATVTDGAGNAVQGHEVTVLSSGNDAIQSPAGDDSVPVTATNTQEMDLPGSANDLPACNDGTNGKGKCVVQVTAPNPEGTANDATRGVHTITLSGRSPIAATDRKVKVDVTVTGPVDSITTDAPARVDPGSRTDIKVTLKDAAGVLVGAQTVEVTHIAGSGVTRNGGPTVTKDGQHTFTYRAASGTGTAEFDIQVRANKTDGTASTSGKSLASLALTIAVWPEPTPPAPALPEQPTAAGITSDAPDRVAPGSRTEITVTVTDVYGELAGMQSVTVTQVSGDGRVINGGPAATTDGKYTFTFRAAGTTGMAEIDVDVRSLNADGEATDSGKVLASTILFIAIGDEAATPPPASGGLPASFYGGGLDAGDVVTASIDGAACGKAEVGDGGGWSILVEEGGCGGKAVDGATIAFAIDGRAARPTATWRAGGLPDDREGGIALTAAGMTIGIRGARAVYVQDAGGGFDIHVVGAPDFVNARFGQRWIVAATPLTLTLDTEGARAFYVQSADGAFDSHVAGAPDFVNAAFARRWIADAIE